MCFMTKTCQQLPLFTDFAEENIKLMMDCFSAEVHLFTEGAVLRHEKKGWVGCVVSGKIEGVENGVMFPIPDKADGCLHVLADSEMLFLDSHMLLYPCYGVCPCHVQLLQRLREAGIDFYALEGKVKR